MDSASVHKFLNEFLTVSNYSGDKDKFISKFLENCHTATIAKLVIDLPEEKKKEIMESALSAKKPMEGVVKEFISQEEYKKVLKEITERNFKELLDSILPKLSPEEAKKLLAFFTSQKEISH